MAIALYISSSHLVSINKFHSCESSELKFIKIIFLFMPLQRTKSNDSETTKTHKCLQYTRGTSVVHLFLSTHIFIHT